MIGYKNGNEHIEINPNAMTFKRPVSLGGQPKGFIEFDGDKGSNGIYAKK